MSLNIKKYKCSVFQCVDPNKLGGIHFLKNVEDTGAQETKYATPITIYECDNKVRISNASGSFEIL